MASLLVFMRPHTVGSQATCWLWLWAILFGGGTHSIKYWGSFIFVFLFNYGLHVLPVWLSVCLSVSNQVVRLISIKISSSGADNIELKKGLPHFAAAFCLCSCCSARKVSQQVPRPQKFAWLCMNGLSCKYTSHTHTHTLTHSRTVLCKLNVLAPSPFPFLGWQK